MFGRMARVCSLACRARLSSLVCQDSNDSNFGSDRNCDCCCYCCGYCQWYRHWYCDAIHGRQMNATQLRINFHASNSSCKCEQNASSNRRMVSFDGHDREHDYREHRDTAIGAPNTNEQRKSRGADAQPMRAKSLGARPASLRGPQRAQISTFCRPTTTTTTTTRLNCLLPSVQITVLEIYFIVNVNAECKCRYSCSPSANLNVFLRLNGNQIKSESEFESKFELEQICAQ